MEVLRSGEEINERQTERTADTMTGSQREIFELLNGAVARLEIKPAGKKHIRGLGKIQEESKQSVDNMISRDVLLVRGGKSCAVQSAVHTTKRRAGAED